MDVYVVTVSVQVRAHTTPCMRRSEDNRRGLVLSFQMQGIRLAQQVLLDTEPACWPYLKQNKNNNKNLLFVVETGSPVSQAGLELHM